VIKHWLGRFKGDKMKKEKNTLEALTLS
jgi:hypothetical protein